jgi:hypothetical protein
MKYAKETGVSAEAIGARVHPMRATAATNPHSNEADIAKVEEWLDMLTCQRPGFMTEERCDRKIVRRFT